MPLNSIIYTVFPFMHQNVQLTDDKISVVELSEELSIETSNHE